MVEWMKEVIIGLLGLMLSFFIYLDKKKTRRFDKIDNDFEAIWDYVENIKKDKDLIDKDLVRLSKEVDMTRQHIDKEFDNINSSQRDMKEFAIRQHQEMKALIEDLTKKVEKYFEATNSLHLELVAHISKSEK